MAKFRYEATAAKMYIQSTSPGKGQTLCKVWLASVERRRCSNEAKTQKPLKLAGVPQTNETISASSMAEVHHIVRTCGGDIAV